MPGWAGRSRGPECESASQAGSPADAVSARPNDRPQDVFGRRVLIEGGANAFQLGGLHGLLHDHGVKAQLVAEVIVDRGDIGAAATQISRMVAAR